MPSNDRMHRMVRQLVEAALDQPNPTPALVAALNSFLVANEHRDRLRPAAVRKSASPVTPRSSRVIDDDGGAENQYLGDDFDIED